MKHLFLLLISFVTYGQDQSHAVMSSDMTSAFCLPKESQLETKKEYLLELRKYNIHAFSLKNVDRVKKEHLADILYAVKLMPSWIKIGKDSLDARIRVVYRHSLKSVANAFIALGPDWFTFNSHMRRAVIFHELAHRLDTKIYQRDSSEGWRNIDGGWHRVKRNDKRIIEPIKQEHHVSKYSTRNPVEDWAESVSSYRLSPFLLKLVSINKYEFIKKYVFLGQEFIDASMCDYKPEFISDSDFLGALDSMKKFYGKEKQALKKLSNKYGIQELLFHLLKSLEEKDKIHKNSPIEKVDARYRLKLFIQNTEDYSGFNHHKLIQKIKTRLL